MQPPILDEPNMLPAAHSCSRFFLPRLLGKHKREKVNTLMTACVCVRSMVSLANRESTEHGSARSLFRLFYYLFASLPWSVDNAGECVDVLHQSMICCSIQPRFLLLYSNFGRRRGYAVTACIACLNERMLWKNLLGNNAHKGDGNKGEREYRVALYAGGQAWLPICVPSVAAKRTEKGEQNQQNDSADLCFGVLSAKHTSVFAEKLQSTSAALHTWACRSA
ncbi:hypothetical protein GQ54DRAFT_181034 [Martensiomyces pterosporus]|nr:hypothetical protein GQ54DRAFT_181034 [Martensiomyces pterosporus]